MPEFIIDVVIDGTIRVQAPTAEDALADAQEVQDYELHTTFNKGRMTLTDIHVRTEEGDGKGDSPKLFTEEPTAPAASTA